MGFHFSVRDVIFNPTTPGVLVTVITDVPCHLWLRHSQQQPRIHKKAILRRGLWLADDVRFCFTIFEDNEQTELGDTLEHTFWKQTWDVCQTWYLYFWGYIAGVVSPSTTAIFTYHNDGLHPVPPPLRNDMILLAKQTLLEPGFIDLNDLNTHLYPTLKLFFTGVCTRVINTLNLQLNSYSAKGYFFENIRANATTVAASQHREQTAFWLGFMGGESDVFKISAEVTIYNHLNIEKSVDWHTGCIGYTSGNLFTNHGNGRLTTTTVEYVKRIQITNDVSYKFTAGTQAILYGLFDP